MILMDTNILVYATKDQPQLIDWIAENAPQVSAITYVEALGYHRLDERERGLLKAFFDVAGVLPITREILDEAVRLRQIRRVKLGDSLIAATALTLGYELATHNVEDFSWIEGLVVVDPLSARRSDEAP